MLAKGAVELSVAMQRLSCDISRDLPILAVYFSLPFFYIHSRISLFLLPPSFIL